MKHDFLLKRITFLLLFLCALPSLYASPQEVMQSFIVKGRVTDKQYKEGVIGANVMVKGTTIGTITDIDGNYSLEVPNKKAVLVFSFIGYQTQEIPVGNKKVIDVVMADDSQALEEVVVVAYGTKSKTTITGALSSMDNKELIKSPAASVTNVLAGSMPGVSSVQTSGQPGKDAAAIYVRGCGSLNNAAAAPLILIDGVERPQDFASLDPNEIESISVLKDASSTAVFGVRGANGVILVTTRRGKTGKPSINVTASLGLQQPISLVEQVGSYEYAKFWNIKKQLDGVTDPKLYFKPEQIEAYRTGSDPMMYPSIDWTDYVFNNVYLQSKNNINISGGSENVKYFVSIGYLYQNGLLKDLPGQPYDNNYRYDRYNYRANIDAKLTNTTTMKLSIGGKMGKTKEPHANVSDDNPFNSVQIWTVPMAGPGFIDGVRTRIPEGMVPIGEVLRDGMFVFYGMGYNQNYDTSLNMDVDITQKLDMVTPGLSVSLKGAYDNRFALYKNRGGGSVESQTVYYQSSLDSNFTLPETDPDFNKSYAFVPTGENTPLTYSESQGRSQNWYLEARVNYDRTFGDHKVGALVLYNQSRNYYPGSYTYIPRSYVGLVGRATYSYKNKYMADFNIGYNGSENFAPGKTRFGLFPALSAGWVMSAEDFMQKQNVFDYLKFRVSWGRVGSDAAGSRFLYMPATWGGNGSYSFGVANPDGSPAMSMGRPGNSEVTWETADKQNYGIDAKFLDNRLSFNFDYFIEHRDGILISPRSLPEIIATSSPDLNIGKVDNHGYEIALGWNDTVGNDFNYYVNANVSYARNEIIFNDEVPNKYPYMDETGGPTGRHKNLYKYVRLYQYSDFIQGPNGELILNPELPQPYQKVYPGDAMYADLNNDGIVDNDDRFLTGYSERPEYMFGLNLGLKWKGFDFSMQWTGATHVNKMYDIEYRIPFTNAGKRGLLTYFYEGCWTPENQQNAIYPRPAEESESWNSEPSTLWLKDSSYFRLKSLNVGYTFTNKEWLRKIGCSSLGITFSGYNLLTFSPLKYIDPEGVTSRQGDYPLVKLYSFGLNVNF